MNVLKFSRRNTSLVGTVKELLSVTKHCIIDLRWFFLLMSENLKELNIIILSDFGNENTGISTGNCVQVICVKYDH